MKDLRSIYREVVQHYLSADVVDANINEIWHHSLDRKGRIYSLDELKHALAPGSPVRGDIYDFNFYIDPTVIDLQDPVSAQLLEQGEHDFGDPLKDVTLQNACYSSKFLSNVAHAATIITLLNEVKVDSPRIMEIGGGVGLLLQILKKYYGDNATVFAVDLPETLLIQEWLLANWFPGVPLTYKGTRHPVSFAEGGLNFINGYVLDSQDVQVDVVININSMQEMDENVCNSYLSYLARNLSSQGFVYFENHFGHGDNSVSEPTEYNFDKLFTTLASGIRLQTDTLNSYEALSLVLGRRERPEDPGARRFVYRILWNGINAGLIPHNDSLVKELVSLPQSVDADTCVGAALNVLRKYNARMGSSDLRKLRDCVHLAPTRYFHDTGHRVSQTPVDRQSLRGFMSTLWDAQSCLIRLMREVGAKPSEWTLDEASDSVKQICSHLLTATTGTENSEVRASNLACILLPLGAMTEGCEVIVNCAARSRQSCWRIRFAHLLSFFGFYDQASWVLDGIEKISDLNPILLADLATIKHNVGQYGEATTLLGQFTVDHLSLRQEELGALARASVAINRPELATHFLKRMSYGITNRCTEEILDILLYSLLYHHHESWKSFVTQSLGSLPVDLGRSNNRLLVGILKHLTGDIDVARASIAETLDDLVGDYYSLGWAGNRLMQARLEDMATQCLEHSVALRPANFMHLEFTGSIYFAAGKWERASRLFCDALKIVPYVRNVRARALYCDLPEEYRQRGVFCDPEGIAMIFQHNQDFYSDVVPPVKPRIRLTDRHLRSPGIGSCN